jgi:hypothetical protein
MTLDDDLVMCRVVLDELFQCIQAAEPDREYGNLKGVTPGAGRTETGPA